MFVFCCFFGFVSVVEVSLFLGVKEGLLGVASFVLGFWGLRVSLKEGRGLLGGGSMAATPPTLVKGLGLRILGLKGLGFRRLPCWGWLGPAWALNLKP